MNGTASGLTGDRQATCWIGESATNLGGRESRVHQHDRDIRDDGIDELRIGGVETLFDYRLLVTEMLAILLHQSLPDIIRQAHQLELALCLGADKNLQQLRIDSHHGLPNQSEDSTAQPCYDPSVRGGQPFDIPTADIVDLSFWRGKRVFLTGHTGFKGSWLALWLQRLGAEVTGYALAPPTDPSLFEDTRVGDGMRSVEGDLRDLEKVSITLRESHAEIVLHLAAQSLVHHGYRHPLETYSTNVLGTAHLLEAVRGCPEARVVVSVTSDKCYENRETPRGYSENDPLGGHDPYSSSKACAELVTAAYRDAFLGREEGGRHPTWTATARSGNVIGGGDWAADRLVPDLVRGFTTSTPARIRCPEATRPWQHVLEPLHGYLVLAERLATDGAAFASAWNFGPALEDARPVRWIADRVVELWGEGAGWELDADIHPPEATYLKLDCTKAEQQLRWRPRLPLETALEWTVEWYSEHERTGDLRRLSEQQLAAYEELICSN